MNYIELYKSQLIAFIESNISLFDSAKKFKDEPDIWGYFPDHSDKQSSEFLGNNPLFQTFSDTMISDLIMDSNIVFDLNGHMSNYHNKSIVDVINDDSLHFKDIIYDSLKFKLLIDLFTYYSLPEKETFSSFLFFANRPLIDMLSSEHCPACNAYINARLDLTTKTIKASPALQKCPMADKTPDDIRVNLKVPSKKLVFLNDPRSFLRLEREDKYEHSISSTLGCIKETALYADSNVGFFFIGNSYPAILQKDNEIVFTNSYDEEDEDDSGVNNNYIGYTLKGRVCADLWWYTILDYDLFLKLCSDKNVDFNSIEYSVVDITSEKCSIKHSLKAHKEGHDSGVLSVIKY